MMIYLFVLQYVMSIIYFHKLCMGAENALARLHKLKWIGSLFVCSVSFSNCRFSQYLFCAIIFFSYL